MQIFPLDSRLSNSKKYHQNMQTLYFKINNLINQFLNSLTQAIRTHGFQSYANRYHNFLMKTFIPLELQSYVYFQCEDMAFKTLAQCSMEPFNDGTRKQKQLLKKTNNINYRNLTESKIEGEKNQTSQAEGSTIKWTKKPVPDIQMQMKLREWILDQIRKKRKVRQIDITRRAMVIAKTDNFQVISGWCKRFLYKYSEIRQLVTKQNNQLKAQTSKVQDQEQQQKKRNTEDKNIQQQVYPNEQKFNRKSDVVAKFLSDSYKGYQKNSRDDLYQIEQPNEKQKIKKKEDQSQLKSAYLRLQQKVRNRLYGYPQ